jgi:hypothetical protein
MVGCGPVPAKKDLEIAVEGCHFAVRKSRRIAAGIPDLTAGPTSYDPPLGRFN